MPQASMILSYKIRPLFVQDGTSESLNLSDLSQYTGYCLRSTFYAFNLTGQDCGLWKGNTPYFLI
jgi:hypothetical protein